MGNHTNRAAFTRQCVLTAATSLAILLFFGGQARCGPQSPLYRGDIQRTGRTTFVATYNPQVAWTYDTGISTSTTPVIGENGTVYYGAMDRYFYAVNSDGNLDWRYRNTSNVVGSAAIDSDGSIYYGTLTGKLYALNSDGTSKWSDPYSFNTKGTYDAMLLGSGGVICFGADDGKVYAVNPDKTLKWSYATGDAVKHGLAASPDGSTLYAASNDGCIYALNSSDGTLRWKSATLNPTDLCAVGNDGTIYVGTVDGSLYAINSNGSTKWRYQAGSMITSAATIGFDGSIYFGCADCNLYAITANGSLQWTYRTTAAVHSAPTVDLLGTVLFGTYSGQLVGLNPLDGKAKWSRSVGGHIYTTPVVARDGSIYVLNNDGVLTKFTGPTQGGVYVPEPSSLFALITGAAIGLRHRLRRRRM